MENTKKTDLKPRKISLRAKLMSALSLLLVSTIMLGTSTYAWFVLSTAPEVKGMSTTVGSNGGLEIALLTDQKTTAEDFGIRSGVGDSIETQNQTKANANITWGNLVDLNDASYGLSLGSMKLYPAVLKAKADQTEPLLTDHENVFSFAQYGYDGRVATLAGTTYAGKFDQNQNAFVISDTRGYGVRGLGTASGAIDQNLFTYNRARNAFLQADLNTAAGAALTSSTVEGLLNIIVKHSTSDTAETYNQTEVDFIRSGLSQLISVTNSMETAVKNGVVAESYTEGKTPVTFDDVTADYMDSYDGALKTLWTQVQTLKTQLSTQAAAADALSGDALSWDDINDILSALMSTANGQLIIRADGTDYDIAEVRGYSQEEKNAFADALLNAQTTIISKQGLLSDTAAIVGNFQTAFYQVSVLYQGVRVPVSKGVSLAAENAGNGANLTAALTAVEAFEYAGSESGETTNAIATFYGYAVDLAFRTNAENSHLLLQSEAAARVTGQEATMGAGSTFTFAEDNSERAASALRVAFVDDQNQVLAIAKLGTRNTDTGAYSLVAYTPAVADGVISASETALEGNVLAALTANQAKMITVIVYFDGNDIDDFADSATGTLNLQFASDGNLRPMEYSFGTTTGGTAEPSPEPSEEPGTEPGTEP